MSLSSFPKYSGAGFKGSLSEMKADLLGFFEKLHAQYGETTYFRVGPYWHLMITNPEDVKWVLKTSAKDFARGHSAHRLKPGLGESLFTTEGEKWRQQRVRIQPAFHKKFIEKFDEKMNRSMDIFLKSVSLRAKEGALDLDAEFLALTMKIAGETLLSVDLGEKSHHYGQAFEELLDWAEHQLQSIFPVPVWIPTRRNRNFNKAMKLLDDLIYSIVAERKKMSEPVFDMLQLLMELKDPETGKGLGEKELRDQIVTFFLAGFETTACALGWTSFLLAQNSSIQSKCRSEVMALPTQGVTISAVNLDSLKTLRDSINESLRLYPPGPYFTRIATASSKIRNESVPKGTIIWLVPYVTQRSAKYWKEPERFLPERFQSEYAVGKDDFRFFPFGGGPSVCIGQNFALMEIMIVLGRLVQEFQLDLQPGSSVGRKVAITLRPAPELPMCLSAVQRLEAH